jgi:hypothetical protein
MSKIDDDEISVETIMARIQEKLQRSHAGRGESYDEDTTNVSPLEVFPFSFGIAHDHMNLLRRLQDPNPQGPISSHGSRLVEPVKRLIRRILTPYHRAIFARQAEFNANVVGLMAELLQALEKSSVNHATTLRELQERLDTLKAEQAAAQQTAEPNLTCENLAAKHADLGPPFWSSPLCQHE